MTIDRRSLLLGFGACLTGCAASGPPPPAKVASSRAAKLIAAARSQVGITIHYDGGYTKIGFPGGDVPRVKGACTDVIVRAYRDAFGLDLQALVNQDMRADFAAYPTKWGLPGPDPNIDHRRVPNLRRWFERHRAELQIPGSGAGWNPGDIFTSRVDLTGTHIGLVSDRMGRHAPMIIHNIGGGAQEVDALLDWPITGRYRWAL